MRKALIALSFLAVLTTSCKKEKEDAPAPFTPTRENLTGSYKMTAFTATTNGQTEDLMNKDIWVRACQKDDLYKLNADNTYQEVDAGVKCDPAGDYSDFWSLTNSTTIVIDDETMTIKSFNGKKLELTVLFNGIMYTRVFDKQ